MRLWYYDLISVLPQKQLCAQWRECCAIARNIAVNGTPQSYLSKSSYELSYRKRFLYILY